VVRSGFASRQAAELALAGELSLLAAGVWVDDRDLTVGSWLQTWLLLQEEAGRSPKTLANYCGHVRDVWAPRVGGIRLRDLRRSDLEQVLVDLSKPIAPDLATIPRDVPPERTCFERSSGDGGRGSDGPDRERHLEPNRRPVGSCNVGRGNVGRRVARRTASTVEGYRGTIRAACRRRSGAG
jgi:hypothetical protein